MGLDVETGFDAEAAPAGARGRVRRGVDAAEIAAEIARLIRRDEMKPGERLVELRLAHALGLSRAPVRRALEQLQRQGLVALEPGRGFVLSADWSSSALDRVVAERGADESAYLRIAADRLDGKLPEVVNEARISRDYELTRSETARLLDRMAREGWIERRAGYGWQFLPTFPTREAYLQGYRFRALVEPAAILEPTFAIDTAAIDRLAASQKRIMDRDGARLSIADVFESGCRFHEELVKCSGNPFMVDTVQRINRMRRLVEYRALDRVTIVGHAGEHLAILEVLRRGGRAEAAELMRRHLDAAADSKLAKLDSSGVWIGVTPTY